ncbi:MAG: glycosyltransferase family 2 protein [Brevinematia bacterium]
MKLSVIMPVFNGERFIVENTERVEELVKSYILKDLIDDYEILVVDDGSSDRTLELLRERFGDSEKVIIVENKFNQGKGFALKNGFFNSSGDVIVMIDSDLDIPPEQIENLLQEFKNGYDVVITSKFEKGSQLRYPIFRKFVSFAFYLLAKILFGLPFKDTQTGLKLFRREVLEVCLSRMVVKRFAFDLELLLVAYRYNFSIKSIPVRINYRSSGFIKPGVLVMSLVDTLAIFYRLKILQFYDRPVFVSRDNLYRFYFIKDRETLEGINCGDSRVDRLGNNDFVVIRRYSINKRLDINILSSLITSYRVEVINGASLAIESDLLSYIKGVVLCSHFLQPLFNLRYKVVTPKILPIPVSNFLCVSGKVLKYLVKENVDFGDEKDVILKLSKKYHSVLFVSDWNCIEQFKDERLFSEFFRRLGILVSTGNIGQLFAVGSFMFLLWTSVVLSVTIPNFWIGIPFVAFFSFYFAVKMLISGFKVFLGFPVFVLFSLIISFVGLLSPLLALVSRQR